MHAAEIDFIKPICHGVLGVPSYVQFTSPIHKYLDLLAHYQVKAFLRGESPPFSAGQLEGMAAIVGDEVEVEVEEAHPRDYALSLKKLEATPQNLCNFLKQSGMDQRSIVQKLCYQDAFCYQ
ncbi:hypothetical protein CRYUN_Cryun05aG0255600 [Craigia yunnanensis]